ncbi:hypothetical protein QA648_35310 (plasmid) [Rhizobium sp. CB3171]|uniref:hypothetical protein n=1 Tax=Rhizobium sp. CB3171 TaxID=3039157 RepID=UPI0024B1D70B|nr:hypothetical protein [Rhizobium sp. CB3171]WFU07174.1 hypothetical protein QA648_35310 [Rhizobium sp. CB3171]
MANDNLSDDSLDSFVIGGVTFFRPPSMGTSPAAVQASTIVDPRKFSDYISKPGLLNQFGITRFGAPALFVKGVEVKKLAVALLRKEKIFSRVILRPQLMCGLLGALFTLWMLVT